MEYDEGAYTGLLVTRSGMAARPRSEDVDDRPSPRLAARLERQRRWQQVVALLGVVYVDTVSLPLDGRYLTARDRCGRQLRWRLWAPVKRVLIDVYTRQLPSADELEDRQAFARANGLRYALVEPGRALTLDALKEWLGT